MEFCDKYGKLIKNDRDKSVFSNSDGIYHDKCADKILKEEDTKKRT